MVERKFIYECLAQLQEYFGRELKPEVQKMYVKRFELLDLDKFKAAMVRIIDEFQPTSTNPFPLIKDVLEMCGMDSNTRAINAVYAVKKAGLNEGQYPSVDFGNPAIHAVIKRFGGVA